MATTFRKLLIKHRGFPFLTVDLVRSAQPAEAVVEASEADATFSPNVSPEAAGDIKDEGA